MTDYITRLATLVDKGTKQILEDSLDLIKQIKYMVGIAERGTGKKCPDGERPEAFLLAYVKSLEAALAQQDAQEIHQWRRRVPDAPWHDAAREFAYARIDDDYEARTLYTSLAQAVPPEFIEFLKKRSEDSHSCSVLVRDAIAMLNAAPTPQAEEAPPPSWHCTASQPPDAEVAKAAALNLSIWLAHVSTMPDVPDGLTKAISDWYDAAMPVAPGAQDIALAAMRRAIDALETAKNGLQWYRDYNPKAVNGSDDEVDQDIDTSVSYLRRAIDAVEG